MDGWKIRPQKELIFRDSANIKAENRMRKMQHIVVKITKPQTDFCAKVYGKQSVVFCGEIPST